MFTRRSASRAAMTAKTGTPIATARTSSRLSVSSAGKNGSPMNGMPATGMRSRKKIPNPAAIPRTAAAVDSVAAISETCLRVAPASRIAANRSSRRAADSRVAVAMKISTGSRMASATTDRMKSTEFAPPPGSVGENSSPLGFGCGGQPGPRTLVLRSRASRRRSTSPGRYSGSAPAARGCAR